MKTLLSPKKFINHSKRNVANLLLKSIFSKILLFALFAGALKALGGCTSLPTRRFSINVQEFKVNTVKGGNGFQVRGKIYYIPPKIMSNAKIAAFHGNETISFELTDENMNSWVIELPNGRGIFITINPLTGECTFKNIKITK